MPKVGGMVRVPHKSLEHDEVVEHGYLWVRLKRSPGAYRHWSRHEKEKLKLYRSIATGFEWEWWDHEIEEAGDA